MATSTKSETQQKRDAADQANTAADSEDAQESRVSDADALRALVEHVLEGPVHPDRGNVLSAWHEQHTQKGE